MPRPGRRRAAMGGAALALLLPGMLSAEGACMRPELAWDRWAAYVESRNPGVRKMALADPFKTLLLAAAPCDETAGICPPERLFAFYCAGNTKVLLAYVSGGCVTQAEEIPVETYAAIVRPDEGC